MIRERRLRDLSLGFLRLLGEEDGLDVRQDTSLGDGDPGEQLVQLLVVPNGELRVAGDDPSLLVVPGGARYRPTRGPQLLGTP